MKLFSVLVTGANRGIGLEFVRQLASRPDGPEHLFATYRNVESRQNLEDIRDASTTSSKVHLIKLDVTKKDELETAKKIIEDVVGDNGLTLLINNAGFLKFQSFPVLTEENLNAHFSVNTIGPVITFQTLLPLLKKAALSKTGTGVSFSRAAVLNISSMAGSITRTGVVLSKDLIAAGYKISKAALNMAMKVAAEVVKEDNILVVNMCPGWVKTDMGSAEAELEPEESISQILKTISTMNESNHGTYVDRFGEVYSF